MKISKQRLQGIIKEELNRLLSESEEEEYGEFSRPVSPKKTGNPAAASDRRAGGYGDVHSVPKTGRYTGSNAVAAMTKALTGTGDAENPISAKEAELEAWKIINMYKKISTRLGDTGAKQAMVDKLKSNHPELADIVKKITHIGD